MPVDLESLSPRAKEAYIALGRQFASEKTLNQAESTLSALGTHADALKSFGFIARDAARLEEIRDQLKALVSARENLRAAKKSATRDYRDAISGALVSRESLRAVLTGVREDLLEVGDDDDRNAVNVALDSTSVAKDTPRELANQLRALLAASGRDAIAPLFEERAGDALAEAAATQATNLDAFADARAAVSPGTPVATEALDILDGMIVSITRRARHSAEAASKAKGQPALLMAFLLDKLYDR